MLHLRKSRYTLPPPTHMCAKKKKKKKKKKTIIIIINIGKKMQGEEINLYLCYITLKKAKTTDIQFNDYKE